jgi:hypothetical protein
LTGLCLAGAGMIYTHNTKPGILFSRGFMGDGIKLAMTKGDLQFYFYEKSQTIGFLVLRKRENGFGWKVYAETSKPMNGRQDAIKILYPTIKNGAAAARSIWGGIVEKAASPAVTLKINGEVLSPDLVSYKKNEYYCFLIDTDQVDESDTLAISVP